MPAVQRLGGEVGRHRVAVPGKGQTRDGLAAGLERRAQALRQRALARAVDTLYRDQHAASLTRGFPSGFLRNRLQCAPPRRRVPKTVRHEAFRVHRGDRRGAVAGTPLAHANGDPAANPPNCSAADLEFVRAGVQASTAAYLFAHPDVNDFFDSLEGYARPGDAEGRRRT